MLNTSKQTIQHTLMMAWLYNSFIYSPNLLLALNIDVNIYIEYFKRNKQATRRQSNVLHVLTKPTLIMRLNKCNIQRDFIITGKILFFSVLAL